MLRFESESRKFYYSHSTRCVYDPERDDKELFHIPRDFGVSKDLLADLTAIYLEGYADGYNESE